MLIALRDRRASPGSALVSRVMDYQGVKRTHFILLDSVFSHLCPRTVSCTTLWAAQEALLTYSEPLKLPILPALNLVT